MARFDPVNASPRPSILDCVEKQWVDRLKIPQNFVVYAFSLPHQLSQEQLNQIRTLLHQWGHWDKLESLANFHSVVKLLFGILKDTLKRNSPADSHAIAEEIFKSLAQDSQALHDQLLSILRDSGTYKKFLASRGDLAQQLLDLLQDLLDSFPESSSGPCLSKALERLSRVSGLHPTCFPLTGLQKVGQQVAAGAFGDIWKGLIRGQSVSVKIMRLFRDADVKAALQEFCREALIWRQLSHPNLLPFFGLYYSDNRLCLVSPWMSNGHVLEFLKDAPPDTNRLSLMLDVAMGLEYLHGKHVVHGDLKGMNILVTPSRRACLADFGLSSIADAMTLRFTHSSASARGGTARYQAPELLSTDIPNHFGSDVYAFGCVCYEMLTGKAPFFEFPRDATVILKVLEGLRPSRSETIPMDDHLWSLMQDCWKEKSCDRPIVSQIIQRLVGPEIGAKPTEAATDWDETFSSKSRRSFQEWPLLPPVTVIERRIFGDDVVGGEYCYRMCEIRTLNQRSACPNCFPERLQQSVSSVGEDQSGSSSGAPPPCSSVEVYHAFFQNFTAAPFLDRHSSPRWPNDFKSLAENYVEMLSEVEGLPADFAPYLPARHTPIEFGNFVSTPPLQAASCKDFVCVQGKYYDRESSSGEEQSPYEAQVGVTDGPTPHLFPLRPLKRTIQDTDSPLFMYDDGNGMGIKLPSTELPSQSATLSPPPAKRRRRDLNGSFVHDLHPEPAKEAPAVRRAESVFGPTVMCEGSAFPPVQQKEENMEILTAWRTVTSDPKFRDSDLADLCSAFASRARCDGTKVVLEPQDMHNFIESINQSHNP